MTMNVLGGSRKVAVALGVLQALVVLGGAPIAVELHHGGLMALTCLFAGGVLSCYVWWREAAHEERSMLDHGLAFVTSLMCGLALYANLTWSLWAAGVPIDIGTVRDGRMGEHYWLGPLTLAYAAVCYGLLHWREAKSREG
jgi:hypothetical protein